MFLHLSASGQGLGLVLAYGSHGLGCCSAPSSYGDSANPEVDVEVMAKSRKPGVPGAQATIQSQRYHGMVHHSGSMTDQIYMDKYPELLIEECTMNYDHKSV